MKKLCIGFFCALSIICLANNKIVEWNAQEYANGNTVQYEAAIYFLKKNNIELKNKRILDVGCGTGETSAFLAQEGQFVHGFDASNNMIQWAQEHHMTSNSNIFFEQCCAETWVSELKYDLATMFFCFHWLTDKQLVLNNIAASLKQNGELFGTFSTTDIPQNPGHAIVKEMMARWNVKNNFNESLGRSSVSTQELKTMLTDAEFEIIICEIQTKDIIFASRKQVEDFTRPVMMSRPFIQNMPAEKREQFFNEYIDTLIPILENNNSNQLIMKMSMTIVHARKK